MDTRHTRLPDAPVSKLLWGGDLKTAVSVMIDREIAARCEERAARMGLTLGQLVEQALHDVARQNGASFSQRWRGRLEASNGNGRRYNQLKERFLK